MLLDKILVQLKEGKEKIAYTDEKRYKLLIFRAIRFYM